MNHNQRKSGYRIQGGFGIFWNRERTKDGWNRHLYFHLWRWRWHRVRFKALASIASTMHELGQVAGKYYTDVENVEEYVSKLRGDEAEGKTHEQA